MILFLALLILTHINVIEEAIAKENDVNQIFNPALF